MKIKIILYYTAFIKVILSSYVKIPFNTISPNISSYFSPSEIISRLVENKIYINISIGTPPQNIPVLLSLQKTIFSISEGHKQTYCNCYNNETSISFNKLDEKVHHLYEKVYDRVYLSTDDIKLNNETKIDKMKFVLSLNEDKDYIDCGIIGLSFINEFVKSYKNYTFLNELKQKNIIDKLNFYLIYDTDNSGHIYFGDLPHEIYLEKYSINDLIKTNYDTYIYRYNFPFTLIKYGDNILFKNEIVELIYEENLMYGPLIYYNLLKQNFFNEQIKLGHCKEDKFGFNSTFFYCNKDTEINKMENLILFNSNLNYTFILTYEDLFYKVNDIYIFMFYFTLVWAKGFKLGKTFFKKYNVIFNQDEKTIAIYKNYKCFEKNGFNYHILIIIFCVIIIIGLFLYIKYLSPLRKRRIRANELEDQFSYESKSDINKEFEKNKLIEDIKI